MGLGHVEPRLLALLPSCSQFYIGTGAVMPMSGGNLVPAISHFRNDLAENHAAGRLPPHRGLERNISAITHGTNKNTPQNSR
jgi:hypothetical protein